MALNTLQKRQRTPWRVIRKDLWTLSPYVPRRIMLLGLSGFNSTQRSFDSIKVFKFSRNVRSFSVNFTLHHHDIRTILPDLDKAGMGQEYDRHKPPNAVQPGVLIKGWYLTKANRNRLNMGTYVPLVTLQIEPCFRLERYQLRGATPERTACTCKLPRASP